MCVLFWPLGMISLVKSYACREAKSSGDVVLAHKNSALARRWGFITLGFGLTIYVIIIIVLLAYIIWLYGYSSTSPCAQHIANDVGDMEAVREAVDSAIKFGEIMAKIAPTLQTWICNQ